jgi:hypothetical protein
MSIEGTPQFRSKYYARPTPKQMIAALKTSRRRLIAHKRDSLWGICSTLPSTDVGFYLSSYIRHNLGGEVWLNGWRRKRGLPTDDESMYAARVAWVNWMIGLLKREQALSK